jgi:DASS family divalent anion:Na+ symporter
MPPRRASPATTPATRRANSPATRRSAAAVADLQDEIDRLRAENDALKKKSVPALVLAPVPRGARLTPLAASACVGVAVRLLMTLVPLKAPAGAFSLFSIFVATITALVLAPLPVGACAFVAVTGSVATGLLPFAEAFSAYQNDVIWLIVLAFFFARGFVTTGLGERLATHFVAQLGASPLGLAYGLAFSEAVVAQMVPATTARAGGIYRPLIAALAAQFESHPLDTDPSGSSARRLGTFLMLSQVHCSGASACLTITAAAQNMLALTLGSSVGAHVAPSFFPWLMVACVPAFVHLLVRRHRPCMRPASHPTPSQFLVLPSARSSHWSFSISRRPR